MIWSDVRFIVPQQYELPERLGTQVNLIIVVLKNGYHVTREILTLFEVPDEYMRVNKISHTAALSQGLSPFLLHRRGLPSLLRSVVPSPFGHRAIPAVLSCF